VQSPHKSVASNSFNGFASKQLKYGSNCRITRNIGRICVQNHKAGPKNVCKFPIKVIAQIFGTFEKIKDIFTFCQNWPRDSEEHFIGLGKENAAAQIMLEPGVSTF